ncbi:hypothetical protein M885DRAFT_509384 [Pelagophyceae sp. CCMP2097]|nr:hypothetical protein M885DRAFT_509384 [Pelagophyceae sp. CCMP2097]
MKWVGLGVVLLGDALLSPAPARSPHRRGRVALAMEDEATEVSPEVEAIVSASKNSGADEVKRLAWGFWRRLRNTEASLDRITGELESLKEEQSSFVAERENELQVLEDATSETMRAKKALYEIEAELVKSRRLAAAAAAATEVAEKSAAAKTAEAEKSAAAARADAKAAQQREESAADGAQKAVSAVAAATATARASVANAEDRRRSAEAARAAAEAARLEADAAAAAARAGARGAEAARGRAEAAREAEAEVAAAARAASELALRGLADASRREEGLQRVLQRLNEDRMRADEAYAASLNKWRQSAVESAGQLEKLAQFSTLLFTSGLAGTTDAWGAAKRADAARRDAEKQAAEGRAALEGERAATAAAVARGEASERAAVARNEAQERLSTAMLNDARAKFSSVSRERDRWQTTAVQRAAELDDTVSLLRRLRGLFYRRAKKTKEQLKEAAEAAARRLRTRSRTFVDRSKSRVPDRVKRPFRAIRTRVVQRKDRP